MGGSIVKKLNGCLLPKKIKYKSIVKVGPFFTAKVSCTQDLVKPTIRDKNPRQIILRVGTNDLKTEQTTSQIAEYLIDLCIYLKKNENLIAVSARVPRLDKLDNKAMEVNNYLQTKRFPINMPL